MSMLPTYGDTDTRYVDTEIRRSLKNMDIGIIYTYRK